MTKIAVNKVRTQVDVERSVPQFQLPYPNDAAGLVLVQALDFCAQKMRLGNRQAVANRLQKGDSDACKYYHYSVAKQVAEYLGTLDKEIKEVYVADYDATPDDICFGEGAQTPPIHLIVWVERKTSAFDSLVQGMNRALAQGYADMVGLRQLAHLLDVQVVNDEDVENRVGYGAMLSSLHNRPIQIWER